MYGGNGGGGGGREFYPPDLGHQLRHAAAARRPPLRPPLPALEHVVLLRPPAAPLSEESTLFDGLNGDGGRRASQSFPIQRYRNFPQLGGKYRREAR